MTAFLIAVECLIIGFVVPGRQRMKYFTPKFMEQFYKFHGLDENGKKAENTDQPTEMKDLSQNSINADADNTIKVGDIKVDG